MLRLTFLGTGTSQGVPMIGCTCQVCRSGDRHDRRLRSSVMVEHFPEKPAAKAEHLPEMNKEKEMHSSETIKEKERRFPENFNDIGINFSIHSKEAEIHAAVAGEPVVESNARIIEAGTQAFHVGEQEVEFDTQVMHIDEGKNEVRSDIQMSHTYEQAHTCERNVEADTRIVIDAGPDFRYQMLREHVMSVDAILLTHEHKDHIAGIDDVRAFNYFDNRPMPIYATERTARAVKKDFDYAFSECRYPGAPEIDLRIIEPGRPFKVGEMEIIPVEGMHYRLPVTGYRIGGLAYLTDFNGITNEEIGKIKGVEVLVINALRHEKHISHFTVREAIEVSRRVGAARTYLTHMSHQIGLHENIVRELPDNIHYAYDGLRIEI